MASMTVTFPDPVANRIIDALCFEGGRPADSTVPKAQFAKEYVCTWMERVTASYEARLAGNTAAQEAADAAKNEITVT